MTLNNNNVQLILEIGQLTSEKKFDELTDLLLFYTQKDIPLNLMIAALRGSFHSRSQISQWNNILNIAKEKIILEDRNPETLLKGL